MMFSPITKIACGVALCASIVATLATWGYLGTRDKLVELQTQYKQLEQANKDLVESKAKLEVSFKQDDTLIVNTQLELNNVKKEKERLQDQIDAIPSKRCPKPVNRLGDNVINASQETIDENVADIDDRLPDSLIGVLKQSNHKGSR